MKVLPAGARGRVRTRLSRLGLAPVGPAADTSAWYDEAYSRTREYREPYFDSRYFPVWTVIADRLLSAGARRVLDIGCGPGQLAAYLGELGLEVTGIDFSPKAIELARRAAPDADFHVGDVLEPHWYEDGYDAFVCTEVLEHLTRDHELVQSWPAGTRCLCTVPDFPYESHVRYFKTDQDVRARYADFFTALAVREFKHAPNADRAVLRYFLFDGIRA
jgi:SAM-dependent methyltransferase